MNEANKRKILALTIMFLIIVSSVVVYVVLDGIDFFDQTTEPIVEEELPEEEVLDPIAIKVMDMMQQLDESLIRGYIEKLVSFGPHPTARRILYKLSNRPIIGRLFDLPIEKVARYIYNELESMGLEVRYHHWEQKPTIRNLMTPNYYPGWLIGDNIEAVLPGTDPSSDEIYVLLAHYDTWARTVGANDDSSGVAAVLAAAKFMSQYSFNHTVRFILMSGEEQGLHGAHAYVEDVVMKNNENVVAALSIEMLGGYHGPDHKDTDPLELLASVDDESLWLYDYIANVSRRYPDFLNFTVNRGQLAHHGSDFIAFLKYGSYGVCIAEPVAPPTMHKPSDTIEKMDMSYAEKASRLVLATIAELAWDVEYE
jgi:hypothetical protein